MAGTTSGGKLAAETNKERYGQDFYSNIAIKSRENWKKTPKEERKPWGFKVMSPEKRRDAGRKGGTKSRRGSANKRVGI